MDVTKDDITYITTSANNIDIVMGESSVAFSLYSFWPNAKISIIDIEQKIELSSVDVFGEDFRYMVYNGDRSELILGEGDISPSSLSRYSYNKTNQQLTLLQNIRDLGGNGQDLAISNDGEHIAFLCGGGNGDVGYAIFDIDSTDLAKTFGEWNTGAYPKSAAFSFDSNYIVTTNCSVIKVFDVNSHTLVRSISKSGYGNYGDYNKVGISRGSKIIYGYDGNKLYFYESTPPVLNATNPNDKANNVRISNSISLSFSEKIVAGTNISGITLKNCINEVPFTYTISGNQLLLDPTNLLSNNTTYVVKIPSGAVNDMSGNSLDTGFSFTFTTEVAEIYVFSQKLPVLAQPWYFNSPTGVALGTDGSIYVVDSDNSQVIKLDNNGGVISKWGSYGFGDGEFISPNGIAVAPSGDVYVTDTVSNRIQKFDRNGNFIMKWGSLGSGYGKFNKPFGVAIDQLGFVYVTDSENHRVQKFDANGSFITTWGLYGSDNEQFKRPWGVAVDSSGNVYIVDSGNNRIQKYSSTGMFLVKWGSPGKDNGQFLLPLAVSINSSGTAYVSDANNCIQEFNSEGVFLAKWGTAGEANGQFSVVFGMAVDAFGTVYVADTGNHRIQKFNSAREFVAKWGASGSEDGKFDLPSRVAVDSSGNIYVVDTRNDRIQKFSPTGEFLLKWGGSGSEDGQLHRPMGIVIDSEGNVYVADQGNHRIQKFSSNGVFIIKWGLQGNADSQFLYPTGVAADQSDNIYVADTFNNRIQKFSPSGDFMTKWGTKGSDNGEFSSVYDVAVDSSGNVFVADSNFRIQKFTSDGIFVDKWGEEGIGPGQFGAPFGLAVDSKGNIFVVDAVNCRIQKFDSSGEYITQWGSEGTDDGQFNIPHGIAADDDGNIFVADAFNHRIQKFVLSGPATPVAIISLTANKTSPQTVNTTIRWSAAATGTSPLYTFKVYKGATVIYTGAWSSANYFDWTPSTPGTDYRIKVNVKNSVSSASKISSYFTITESATPVSITSLTANKTSPRAVNTTIRWTAAVTGTNPLYAFRVYKGATVIYTGAWSSTNYFDWTPSTPGTDYRIKVYVKNSVSSTSKISSYFTITQSVTPVSITSLTANKTSPQAVNTTIRWTVVAQGTNLLYAFRVYKGGTVIYTGPWSSTNYFDWTPSAPGTNYRIKAYVKNSVSSASKISSYFTITESATLVSITSLTANKTSPQTVNTTIRWTTAAQGTNLLYAFRVYKGGTVIYTGPWSSTNYFDWTPSTPGTDYRVKAYVKNSLFTVSWISSYFTITQPVTQVSITSFTANKTSPQTVNTTIRWTAAATGTDVFYAFRVYKGAMIIYTGPWSSINYFDWTPLTPGTDYRIKVYAKNSVSSTSQISSYFTVT